MSTIAQVKHQVDRIWYASFQTDLADTLASHLRRHALAGVQAALELALVEADAAVGMRDDANIRRAGNVTLVLRDSVWTDARYKQSGTVLKVKPFSDAYFKIGRAHV